MFMLVSILCAGVVVTALCAALLSSVEPERSVEPELKIAVSPPRFFGGDIAPAPGRSQLPVEVVLSQIEQHIRLEQAAVKAFLEQGAAKSPSDGTHPTIVN